MSLVKLIPQVYVLTNEPVSSLKDSEAINGTPQKEDADELIEIIEQELGLKFVKWSEPKVIDLLVEVTNGNDYYLKSKCKYAIVKDGNNQEQSLTRKDDLLLLFCNWGQVPDYGISKLVRRGDFTRLMVSRGYELGSRVIERAWSRQDPMDKKLSPLTDFLVSVDEVRFDATFHNGDIVPFNEMLVGPSQVRQVLEELNVPLTSEINKMIESLFESSVS